MSDLNCGCGCDSCENRISSRDNCGCNNCGSSWGFGGNNSCLWIILLLIFCGGCGGSSWGRSNDCGCGCGNDSCLWIILLLIFCGGNGCC
ncbi:MAG: chorion class high-cysteine HCB protein 13 [Schaedlerella sp.]|nr:chorion class high-cysteine HCB protein 13 [Schaedlerella sp.]